MRRRFEDLKLLALGLVTLLGLTLALVACGDSGSPGTATVSGSGVTAPASTGATTTPPAATSASAPIPEVTSTPVVLPTRTGGRATNAPATLAATPVATLVNLNTTTSGTRSAAPVTVAVTTAPPTTAASTTAAATVTTQPQTQFSPVTGFPGKLSIVGNDNNIYISRFDGKPPALLLGKAGVSVNAGQDGELFIFPTWSHDGTKLAAGSFLFHNGTPDSVSIYVAAADGSNTFKVQDAEKFTPVYLSWSPDGNYLSMLVGNTGSNELDLRVVDTSKGAAGVKANGPRSLLHGNPLYSSWAADSDTLVIHFTSSGLNVLSQVKAKDAKSSPQPFKLTGDPGAFRAPAWSADGSRLAFSTVLQGQSNEVIVVQDKNGALQGTIDGVGQGAVFNWSPNGARLAYGLRAGSSQRLYDGVLLSDLAGADAPKNGKISGTKIINDPVLSFFWSPDGKKLAYSTIDNASSRFVWNVYDLDSKKSTKLADWYPSDETTQVLSFFDQYAQSDSLWSPDSKALVFSGWVNATINNSTLTGDPIVYVMPTEGAKAGQVQAVAPGGLAFWAK